MIDQSGSRRTIQRTSSMPSPSIRVIRVIRG